MGMEDWAPVRGKKLASQAHAQAASVRITVISVLRSPEEAAFVCCRFAVWLLLFVCFSDDGHSGLSL